MSFDPSRLHLVMERPWRYTTQPTYDAQGNQLTPGVKQTLNGVFIMLSEELVEYLAAKLTEAEKTELRQWAHRVTGAEAGEWHVPMWCGDDKAIFIRVPAAVWNDPATPPPAKVRQYFADLFRE